MCICSWRPRYRGQTIKAMRPGYVLQQTKKRSLCLNQEVVSQKQRQHPSGHAAVHSDSKLIFSPLLLISFFIGGTGLLGINTMAADRVPSQARATRTGRRSFCKTARRLRRGAGCKPAEESIDYCSVWSMCSVARSSSCLLVGFAYFVRRRFCATRLAEAVLLNHGTDTSIIALAPSKFDQ